MIGQEKEYHKGYIAKEQLRTAVMLFLNKTSYPSVITLAGASSNILTQLVKNKGKTPFIDYACNIHNKLRGFTPKRQKYNKYINDFLGIDPLKHMSKSCPEHINLDIADCALHALIKAVADYITLNGKEEPFIVSFLNWTWNNLDREKIMDKFQNAPKKIKNKI